MTACYFGYCMIERGEGAARAGGRTRTCHIGGLPSERASETSEAPSVRPCAAGAPSVRSPAFSNAEKSLGNDRGGRAGRRSGPVGRNHRLSSFCHLMLDADGRAKCFPAAAAALSLLVSVLGMQCDSSTSSKRRFSVCPSSSPLEANERCAYCELTIFVSGWSSASGGRAAGRR